MELLGEIWRRLLILFRWKQFGAGQQRVLLLILRHGALLVAGGIALGIAGAWGATRVLRTLLYRVEPADPVTFVSVTVLLILVALAACCFPAYRATRTAPTEALRYE
jgi:putative ABC transport system permease protein